MLFKPTDAAALDRILKWRRDVRHFQTAPISAELLERLKEAMQCAPSVGNARPWRVIQVDSKEKRSAVRANFAASNEAAAGDYENDRRDDYLRLKLAGLDRAPVQLAVFTVTDPGEGHGLGRRTMPETLRQSTAMAIHTLWLAARARNLGVGMVSILEPKTIESILDVPSDWEFTAYLCIGWPEFHDDTPLLDRAGWQKNTSSDWQRR